MEKLFFFLFSRAEPILVGSFCTDPHPTTNNDDTVMTGATKSKKSLKVIKLEVVSDVTQHSFEKAPKDLSSSEDSPNYRSTDVEMPQFEVNDDKSSKNDGHKHGDGDAAVTNISIDAQDFPGKCHSNSNFSGQHSHESKLVDAAFESNQNDDEPKVVIESIAKRIENPPVDVDVVDQASPEYQSKTAESEPMQSSEPHEQESKASKDDKSSNHMDITGALNQANVIHEIESDKPTTQNTNEKLGESIVHPEKTREKSEQKDCIQIEPDVASPKTLKPTEPLKQKPVVEENPKKDEPKIEQKPALIVNNNTGKEPRVEKQIKTTELEPVLYVNGKEQEIQKQTKIIEVKQPKVKKSKVKTMKKVTKNSKNIPDPKNGPNVNHFKEDKQVNSQPISDEPIKPGVKTDCVINDKKVLEKSSTHLKTEENCDQSETIQVSQTSEAKPELNGSKEHPERVNTDAKPVEQKAGSKELDSNKDELKSGVPRQPTTVEDKENNTLITSKSNSNSDCKASKTIPEKVPDPGPQIQNGTSPEHPDPNQLQNDFIQNSVETFISTERTKEDARQSSPGFRRPSAFLPPTLSRHSSQDRLTSSRVGSPSRRASVSTKSEPEYQPRLVRSKSIVGNSDQVPSRWRAQMGPPPTTTPPTLQDMRSGLYRTIRSRSTQQLNVSTTPSDVTNPTTRLLASLANNNEANSSRQPVYPTNAGTNNTTSKIPSRFLRRMPDNKRLYDQINQAKMDHKQAADDAKKYG